LKYRTFYGYPASIIEAFNVKITGEATMALTRRFSLILFVFFFVFFQFQAFAQQSQVVFVNSSSKELKRTAHRLRIPVDQLRKAREALQEATNLAIKTDPPPVNQLSNLVRSWQNINRSNANGVVDSFIQDLRAQAAQPKDVSAYQTATSTAMSLLQSQQSQSSSGADYEKILDTINSWPDPPASFGEKTATYRKDLETQLKSQSIMNLANSNPEKAYELLSQSQDKKSVNFSDYYPAIQVARNLMNKGKKDEAMKIIDQTENNFAQQANDPRTLDAYGSFVSMVSSMGFPATDAIVEKYVTQLTTQPQQSTCAAKVQSGQTTLLDLTCSESKILNVVRNLSSRPGLAMKTLNSAPGLKAKLDRIGGIDSFTSSSMSGQPISVYTYDTRNNNTPQVISSFSSGGGISVSTNSPDKLLQELRGKAETSPSLVKQKLRSTIKGPEDIDVLITLANSASSQDPELGSLALDLAQELLPQVEPLQKRTSTLQSMVRAYRQVDGEVDPELLKTGFILADQLRQEQADRIRNLPGMTTAMSANLQNLTSSSADQLETFLVSELSRDSFDLAMRYVRSMDNGLLKLNSLVQIVQALSQQY
jgi:hypothetical protein